MATDLPLRCSCGQLEGVARAIAPERGNRVLCYCDDCQVFQHFLGRADDVLDAHGGTDIFQVLPADLTIDRGLDQLACVRLTPRGALRWYADCCKTPLANTFTSGGLPFAGLFRVALADAPAGPSVEQALGPTNERVFKRFARGDVSGIEAYAGGSTAMLFRLGGKLIWAKLRRSKTSLPFFEGGVGAAVSEPQRLDAEARRELDRQQKEWMACE